MCLCCNWLNRNHQCKWLSRQACRSPRLDFGQILWPLMALSHQTKSLNVRQAVQQTKVLILSKASIDIKASKNFKKITFYYQILCRQFVILKYIWKWKRMFPTDLSWWFVQKMWSLCSSSVWGSSVRPSFHWENSHHCSPNYNPSGPSSLWTWLWWCQKYIFNYFIFFLKFKLISLLL